MFKKQNRESFNMANSSRDVVPNPGHYEVDLTPLRTRIHVANFGGRAKTLPRTEKESVDPHDSVYALKYPLKYLKSPIDFDKQTERPLSYIGLKQPHEARFNNFN